MEPIKIINAHYYRLIRESVTTRINATGKFQVVAEAGNEEQLLELVGKNDYDIVLLGIENKHIGKYNMGVQLLEMGIKNLIIISSEVNAGHVQLMFGLGAKGYITKNVRLEEYFLAIEEVYNGGKYVSSDIRASLTDSFCKVDKVEISNNTLSKRQRQILNFLKSGFTSNQIAEQLELSPNTIQVHRYNILKKLNMKNTASLIDYCVY